ncbi:dihydrofolate reductase [Methylocapsa acidiphila]|uniref:dihydrofolate reductase n=1 Tax=Methylocapsa acidiphila TaxID=133552 RepID=UPI00041F0B78|nr:dihydrofolate reductase [Methylocapsa acidiphila]
MTVPLALVAAIAKNGVIGAENRMPWRLPSDLKRFRSITLGKPLLMGRKTFHAIGRALPGRETVILTRDLDFKPFAESTPGVYVAHELEAALALSAVRAAAMGAEEIIVAGGADLYAALIARARRMRLTFVDLAPEGDVRFPAVDWSEWIEESWVSPEPDPMDEAKFAFVDFRRR